nr:MAG TPA: hypothetical protein [Caudoviricetes sp.]
MSKEVLNIIDSTMKFLGLEYGLGEYGGNSNGKIVYPYWVGSYTETEPYTEDGLQETTVMLTGFSRGSWLDLENGKEKIEKHFNRVSGKVGITSSGNAVAIFYAGALIVPTGDAELKSIQINLSIKEWKVN